jgi:hypothetical protein
MSTPIAAISAATMASGLAAIRDVGRAGYQVIGASPRRPAFDAHSRWSLRYLELPPPRDAAMLLDVLAQAKVGVMLPMESSYVGVLSRYAAANELPLRAAVPPLEGFLCAYDNRRTLELCRRLQIPAPRLLSPEQFQSTVVVKPREDVGAARGVTFCRDAAALSQALAACRSYGEPLMQEYIPGGTEAMRTVVLLFDQWTRLVAYFTTQKLEQYPASGGVTAMSISTDDRALVEMVLPLFESLRWRGPAEVELKIDARNGKANVIEINPKLPGYVAFAIECGLHLPRLAIQVALGETPSFSGYAVGRRYVQPGLVLKALVQAWQAGTASAKRLRRDCAALLTAPWVRWDDITDPMPRLAKAFAEASGWDVGLAPEQGLRLVDLEPTSPRETSSVDGVGDGHARSVSASGS